MSWSAPTFSVELVLSRLGVIVRSRVCRITSPMGLRRSVNTALRVAVTGGTGIPDATAAAWRCSAIVPRAFAERFGITMLGEAPRVTALTRKGRVLCDGVIT